jgi:tyrosine-protein kinase Etk/Wzc
VSRPLLTVSVAQVAVLLRERAAVVLGTALVLMAAALTVGYGSELVFVARAQLFLGEVSDAGAEDSGPSVRDADGISGELDILGSASLVERATLAAGLNASVGPERRPVPRYSEWLWAGGDYAALPRADNELAVAEATIVGTQRETYAVELLDESRYQVWAGGTPLAEGRLGQPLKTSPLSWTLLAGPVRRPRVGFRYEIVVLPTPIAALEVSERLRVSAPRASGSPHYGRTVTLEFTAGSPYRAERFLTALSDAYLAQRHDRKVGKLIAREAYLDGESRSVERALQGVEQKLAAARASRRVLWLGDEDNPLLRERARYEAAEARSMLEVARLSVYGLGLVGPAPPLATFLKGDSDDTQLQALSEALAEAERDLTHTEQTFAPGAIELRERQARVADLKRAIETYVERRLGRAQERQLTLARLVEENERELAALDQSKQAVAELIRDQSAYAATYTRLLSQKAEALLVIAKAVSKDRIIDAARTVAEPASPNLREALSSGLFGLFVGALLVLFHRLTAATVQAESDARRFLGEVPVVLVVPYFGRRPKRHAVLSDVIDAAAESGHSPFEDAFRLLGMSLFGAQAEPSQQIVFVTSPSSGDGKTSCALALGLSLARRGRRALIVDAGPARLRASGQSGGDPAPGLEQVLTGKSSLRAARTSVAAGTGELHLLRAGSAGDREPPATAEQLGDFLGVMRARYDVVLVDVPGHAPSNALAVIGLAERVLCVVRLRHTERRRLDELLGSLPRSRTAALVVDPRLGRFAGASAPRVMPFGKDGPVASRG